MPERIATILLLCGALFSCTAQSVSEQIDRDVWHPFVESFGGFDDDKFISIHTDDVVRVSRDGESMLVGSQYAESIRNTFAEGRERGTVRRIEFSFIDRLSKDDRAYEVGYYRVTSASGGQEYVGYGKFHVVLKKVDGVWKIAVDSDTNDGGAILEEDFMSGAMLQY